jgi:anthranilate phosphoribosyltransferase
LGFLYAPKFHPALAKVARLRKTIGIRTIFNTVGPLCNPCTNIAGQVVGVSETSLLDPISTAMPISYGSDTMVIHAHDGFDELSNTCENDIIQIVDGKLRKTFLHPKEYGMQMASLERLIIHDKEESVKFTLESLYGQSTKEKEDIVALNAAAALVVGKIAKDVREGIEIARKTIKSGASRKKLYNFIKRSGNIYTLEDLERKFDL